MTRRQIALLACSTALAATGLGAAAPSLESRSIHRVMPGGSIQKAVDAAKPGDTIVLSPGTYRESVRITTSRLTLRGAGGLPTVLEPGAGTDTCAKAGNGICVTGTDGHPVEGVTVRSLTLRGFARNGLWASWTDRLKVQQVTAEKNGTWGIAQERSVRSTVRRNIARENGDAGLFLGNTLDQEQGATDTMGTRVSENRVSGNRIGITVRRLRNLAVERNEASGNCAAVFVVGDESSPRAGAMSVRRNNIHDNNKLCPKTPRLPALQGSGIVLTGAEETVVAHNRVVDNVGTSPLSGGIVLFKSFVGVVSERNEIRDNVVLRNGSADLANRDTAGTGNTFRRNTCGVSEPAGLC
ncbi:MULTISPECIES: nitrous oxide reductase family maturation protein NosD [unclassified Streptomyces]|uniref:right-handed parallel beta-helix repeat-containing protein n=1 Tax=unclassified Streptomyces TaxID=2593676 RepID=UPI0035D60999